jgi:hypothetical protein
VITPHLRFEPSLIGHALTLRQPQRFRSSALDQIGLAEARMIQGEVDEATRLADAAIALVAQTPSDRVRIKLDELYRRTVAYADTAAVADMRDRIRPLVEAYSD